ncbi:MAG: hypothetical protein AAF664_21680, partial [Planctomycetota bacterium]
MFYGKRDLEVHQNHRNAAGLAAIHKRRVTSLEVDLARRRDISTINRSLAAFALFPQNSSRESIDSVFLSRVVAFFPHHRHSIDGRMKPAFHG